MGSMKEGPGTDPFADDDEESDEEPEPEPETETESKPTDTMSTTDIPYVVRRQRVKDDRPNEHVAFLRDEYSNLEAQILADVADELGMSQKDVSLLDIREALVELGNRHDEELAEILNEWGYEHLR